MEIKMKTSTLINKNIFPILYITTGILILTGILVPHISPPFKNELTTLNGYILFTKEKENIDIYFQTNNQNYKPVSYTHLRAHETV